jgi:glutaredoxin 3
MTTSATPVTMYGTSWCPFCNAAKAFLDERGLAYEEHDLDADPARRDEMRARGGGHTVPQIWVHGTHVGGYTDMVALERSGRLAALLDGDGSDNGENG